MGRWTWSRAAGLLGVIDRLVQGVVRAAFRFAGARLGPITVVVLAAAAILSICNWGLLQTGAEGLESGSTTIRNLTFLFAGLIGLPLAIWRSLVSERQADTAQRQAEIAQQDLLNERYQRGAAMLGSEVLPIRLGGIYALESLAKEHSKQYHVTIMQLLCAYARHARSTSESDPTPAPSQSDKLGDDVQAILTAVASRQDNHVTDERTRGFRPNFSGATLPGLTLWSGNLSNSIFSDSILTNARLIGINLSNSSMSDADLSNSLLWSANLSHATFWDANLTGAMLSGANISGARFSIDGHSSAIGLTQKQLDEARADPDHPPYLEGVVDTQTGELMEWQGEPLEEIP